MDEHLAAWQIVEFILGGLEDFAMRNENGGSHTFQDDSF